MAADPATRTIYTVARLNAEARRLLEGGLGIVWVQGELSNLSRPGSGHWYFSLKDADAQVRCAMFRQRNLLLRFAPKEGQQLLARARVGLYEPRGEYQLVVDHLEEAGIGALQQAFEALRARLAAEGLFDAARKRPLPAAPARVGVITSPTGAALRDILHVLRRRFPAAEVLVHPVPVQGAAAPAAIAAALDLAGARAECDVLILARGGGSLEDLQAFNDERVARAIARCPLPVISGVGHETDVTIADFVADLRAPTPTAAAQAAVPDRAEWLDRLALLAARFGAAARRALSHEQARVSQLAGRLQRAHPGQRLGQHAQRLDELDGRLQRAMAAVQARGAARLATAAARLAARSPAARLQRWQLHCQALASRLHAALQARMQSASSRLGLAARGLHATSPLATLDRGFAILQRPGGGALVRTVADLAPGDEFDARLADGTLRARALGPAGTGAEDRKDGKGA